MKKTIKYISILLCLVMVLTLAACGSSGNGNKIKTIGINQYGEHASLDNCRIGFLQGLEEAGLKEGVDFRIDYQNAQFDDNINTQIAASFAANNVDLMCGIATPSAVACFSAAEDKDIPVIFTAISDPVQAGLDSGNITGTSDKLPVEAQLELIRQIQPDAKVIGIIYTTSEPNSVSTIAEYQAKAGDYGFTIDAVGVTSQSEVPQAVDALLSRKVDLFSNLTDNNVVGVLPAILEKTNEAYALAKISGLKYCEYLNRQYGTDYISVMPTNLYGPNDNYHPEHSHVLPALIRRFHEAKVDGLKEVTCWGDGSPLREFLYVDDLANLCVFLMNNYSGNETVNAGTGKELTIKALTELVAKVVGYEGEIKWDTSRPNGTPRKLLDVSKATALGWTYKTELEEGIRLAYEDFLHNPMRAER